MFKSFIYCLTFCIFFSYIIMKREIKNVLVPVSFQFLFSSEYEFLGCFCFCFRFVLLDILILKHFFVYLKLFLVLFVFLFVLIYSIDKEQILYVDFYVFSEQLFFFAIEWEVFTK